MSCRLYKKSQRVLVSRCPITLQFALCCRLRAGTNATNRSARLMPWQSQVPTWLHLQGPRAQQTYSTQRSQCMRMQSPPTQPWMSSCCPMTMTAAVGKNQLPSGRRHPGLSRLWLQTSHLIALQLPMPPMTLRRGHPWQHRRLDSTRNLLSSLLERCCSVLAPSRRAKHSRTAFRSHSHQRLASRQQRRRRPPQAAQLLLGRRSLQPRISSQAARAPCPLTAAHRHMPNLRRQRTSLQHQQCKLHQPWPGQCRSCRLAPRHQPSESVLGAEEWCHRIWC